MAFQKNTCIIISGPTAIGKTAVAIGLAKHFSTEIISADSRQCYRELNIGVARPSAAELQEVTHHFIASHSIHDTVNAAVFEEYALEKVKGIFQNNRVAVMAGGTGLYIKAFCGGIDLIPETAPGIRETIIESFEQRGLDWLQQQIQETDPEYFAAGEIQNPQRMMRALEVKMSTGRSILSFQKKQPVKRDFNIIQIALELPRDLLYERINTRVDKMMDAGLLEEVISLQSFQHLNALQTVGYSELFEYLEGKSTLQSATDLIRQNTRHYAKRQLTWFRKDTGTHWCKPELSEVLSLLRELK